MDGFSYWISDPSGATSTAIVTVDVAAVNDAPMAMPDMATTTSGITVEIDVLANDSDVDEGDVLTIVDPGVPSNGTTTTDGLIVTYTPAPGFSSIDTFEYTIADLAGATSSATTTVTVEAGLAALPRLNPTVNGGEIMSR